jgi:hypothetical protein
VSDNPPIADDLALVTERSGIPIPNPLPYSHITVALVAWNEEARLEPLLSHLRPYFECIAIGVQASSDRTGEIAAEWADVLVYDDHRGYGDATFGPRLLPQVRAKWTFKVDCDEWPSDDLLSSLSSATWYAEANGLDGVWVPFHSSVDGIEYEEQHSHLRLFETGLGWPGLLHSRPGTNNTCLWNVGHIRHDRSLDEMMQDYLRYWKAGHAQASWDEHNRLMMYWACIGTARVKGWDEIRAYPWWPEVEAIAFIDEKPWQVAS